MKFKCQATGIVAPTTIVGQTENGEVTTGMVNQIIVFMSRRVDVWGWAQKCAVTAALISLGTVFIYGE